MNCEKCNAEVIQLDPLDNWVLYSIFGRYMTEHRPDCPDYPKLKEVKLKDL